MKRLLPFALLFATLIAAPHLSAQPLIRPFTFVPTPGDSTLSAWLPSLPPGAAGSHGFVRSNASGHLEFTDGTPARFTGVSLLAAACFPDSTSAIAIAARLQKHGVNLVRFVNIDYNNFNSASVLATGTKSDSLSAAQMKRLDWFLHHLRARGIYAHLVLKSRNAPRRDDGVWGWDSVYNSGQTHQFISAPMRSMQQRVITKLLSHANQYTGLRYADDPAIALMTITDQASPWYFWTIDYLNERSGIMSHGHSRMLDSLYSIHLQRRYGGTPVLRTAYYEGIRSVAPNSVANPGFESFTDSWELVVGEAAQASLVVVQGTDAAPGEGPNSLRVAVRATPGNESRIYLQQSGLKFRTDGIYRVRFRAKTDTAAGRPMRIYMFRNAPPYYGLGFDTTVSVTTAWQTYEVTMRSTATDSVAGTLRFYIGRSLGDIFLDGIEIQETGREGVLPGEAIEARNMVRPRFSAAWRYARRRAVDLADFYDSLGRTYYRDMTAHLRSLGVRVPIAGTNQTSGISDTRTQSEFDFTSESASFDFNGARPGMSYSDSTWVIRQYSILTFRDSKIPEFSRSAIVGKPFIAEAYGHAYPNRNRAEMMLYMPAYASLHDWDGAYLYYYTTSSTEFATRRRAIKDEFYQVANDPSVTALLPQFAAIMRNRWIAPATRTIELEYDSSETRDLPINYYISASNNYNTDGSMSNVVNMVHAVRIKTFDAERHMTGSDYYFTVPEDDKIESDTREIVRDITRGTMSVNTPFAQGGSGALGNVSILETSDLGVSWIDGAQHATYLWTTLDSNRLDSSRRSLLTITTRSVNEGAAWQFGDSSLGKVWGTGSTQLESVRLGLNFYTDADSLYLIPLDSSAQPTLRRIPAVRSGDSWRVVVDLGTEATPWFGVQQIFTPASTTHSPHESSRSLTTVGDIMPMPVTQRSTLNVSTGATSSITARVYDALGRNIMHQLLTGPRAVGSLVAARLVPGAYTVVINVDGRRESRRFIVARP
ncbi:MAG: carbohydrate binding domain-containing protein [bacterium]|nr:carbohydrate binding domain-containing protein [Candidatus Kapabacteria bacterium]